MKSNTAQHSDFLAIKIFGGKGKKKKKPKSVNLLVTKFLPFCEIYIFQKQNILAYNSLFKKEKFIKICLQYESVLKILYLIILSITKYG